MDGNVYLARRRNLLGVPKANLATSGAEPDKRFPFIGTNPIILFILILNFSHRISVDTFKIFIYKRLFIQKVLRHVINCLISRSRGQPCYRTDRINIDDIQAFFYNPSSRMKIYISRVAIATKINPY